MVRKDRDLTDSLFCSTSPPTPCLNSKEDRSEVSQIIVFKAQLWQKSQYMPIVGKNLKQMELDLFPKRHYDYATMLMLSSRFSPCPLICMSEQIRNLFSKRDLTHLLSISLELNPRLEVPSAVTKECQLLLSFRSFVLFIYI